MTSPLHKAPRLLSEQFWLRAQGKQPDKFGDTVQPVVDIGQHYFAGNLTTIEATVAADWDGSLNSLIVTVPRDMWLHSIDLEVDSDPTAMASGWLNMSASWVSVGAVPVALRAPILSHAVLFGTVGFPASLTPGDGYHATRWFPYPWLVTGGTQFEVLARGDFTSDPQGNLYVRLLASDPALNV